MRSVLQVFALGLVLVTGEVAAQPGPPNCSKPSAVCQASRFYGWAPSGGVSASLREGSKLCMDGPTNVRCWSDAAGVLTWTGSISVNGSYASAPLLTSAAAAGSIGLRLETPGARLKFSSGGLNDWCASDGGVIRCEGSIESGSVVKGSLLNASDVVTIGTGGLAVYGSTFNLFSLAAGLPLRVSDAEGLQLMPIAGSTLMPFDGGNQGGILAFDGDAGTLKVSTGTNGTYTWRTVNTSTATGDTREGAFCGYWPLVTTDGAAHAFTAHTSQNGGRSIALWWTSTLVGTGAGGFVVDALLPDAGVLCTTGSLACNVAVFTPTGTACGNAFLPADVIKLRYTGSCNAGANPTGNATLSISE